MRQYIVCTTLCMKNKTASMVQQLEHLSLNHSLDNLHAAAHPATHPHNTGWSINVYLGKVNCGNVDATGHGQG